jgi:hypothetical protein
MEADLAHLGTRIALGFLYNLGAGAFMVFCFAVSPLLDWLCDSLISGWRRLGLLVPLLKHLRK